MLLLALLSTAQAEMPASASLGISWTTNDPFLKRRGLSGSYAQPLGRDFGLLAEASLMPDFGEADWTSLTKQIVEENNVSPDISKRMLDASLSLTILLTELADDEKRIPLYGYCGIGISKTVDDLAALQAEGDIRAESTAVQIHPEGKWGLYIQPTLKNSAMAVRLKGGSSTYIETVNGVTLEMKNNYDVGIELALNLGGGK
jgi:hypothetical protein